jgi:hypothetical protein
LVGALVTFSPASSSRDGGAGAFVISEVLADNCGKFARPILAFSEAKFALVTFSPASSSRDGVADTLAGAFVVAEVLVDICGVITGVVSRQIATEPKMHK